MYSNNQRAIYYKSGRQAKKKTQRHLWGLRLLCLSCCTRRDTVPRALWGPFHTDVNYATTFSFVSSKLITHNYNYRCNRRKTRIQPYKRIYKKSGYFLFYLSITLFWGFLINLVTLKRECTHYITWIFLSKHIFWFPATKLIYLTPIFPLLSFSIGQSHLILCIFSD